MIIKGPGDLKPVFYFVIDQPAEAADLFDRTIVSASQRERQFHALCRIKGLNALDAKHFFADTVFVHAHFLHGNGQVREVATARIYVLLLRATHEEKKTPTGPEQLFHDLIGNVFSRENNVSNHQRILFQWFAGS